MSVEQNKANLHTIIEEVFNKGNISIIPKLIAPGWICQNPYGKEFKGPEGFKQFVTMYRNAFPDLQLTIDDVVGEGDTLAARLTWRGTFKGKLGEIKPTGKKLDMPFAYFYYYKDGKETGEPIGFSDTLTMYQQLGIKPPG
jgi:predicted ester cyclase